MNVTSTRFATNTRPCLFIAALTALPIGIGALAGGMFLYAFVALAATMNVFGYWATPGQLEEPYATTAADSRRATGVW